MQEKELESSVRPTSGTVTAVRAQRRRPNRVSVFIDGEFSFGVHRDVAQEFGIRKEECLSDELIEKALARDVRFRARDAAYNLLSYRQRTEDALQRRLVDKGFDAETAQAVVSELVERGLVDDRAFAEELIDQRLRSRSFGALRIRNDLLSKGVPRVTADEAIQRIEHEVDWRSKALEAATKKWNSMPDRVDLARRRKRVYDHLARRGFSYELIRDVVAEVIERE